MTDIPLDEWVKHIIDGMATGDPSIHWELVALRGAIDNILGPSCQWRFRDGRACDAETVDASFNDHVPLCQRHMAEAMDYARDRDRIRRHGDQARLQREEERHRWLRRSKGSVSQRGAKWIFEYQDRDVDGERIRIRRGGYATRQAASKALADELSIARRSTAAAMKDTRQQIDAAVKTEREVVAKANAENKQRKSEALDLRRQERRASQRQRLVYYVRRPDGSIKIGTTHNMQTRLQAFRNVSPVEVLAIHTGGQTAEAAMHKRFAASRLDGEWFNPTPDLLAHIEGVLAVRPLAGESIGGRQRLAA